MDPYSAILEKDLYSFEFCEALAAIGRTNAALVAAAAATELTSAPEEKNRFLALLARLLGSRRPTTEAATNRAIFGGVPAQVGTAHRASTSDQLALFVAAGKHLHPLSYAAAIIDDRRRALDVGPAMTASDPLRLACLLMESVGAGGPTKEVEHAFAAGAAAWIKRAQAALRISPLGEAGRALASIRCVAGQACAYFLLRRSSECCQAASMALVAIGNHKDNIHGLLDYEAVTVAMVAAICIGSDVAPYQPEELIAALVRPRNTHFSSRLRSSFYFSACGHAYRRLALLRGAQVTISLASAEKAADTEGSNRKTAVMSGTIYNREMAIEAARKYIVAAATLPSDDPELPRRYDRVLWCLLLAGGVSRAALWPFLVARGRAEVELYSAPVAECALYLDWPCFKNGPEIISQLFDSCLAASQAAYLLPTFVEAQNVVYASNGFFPSVSKFVCLEGCVISPCLRPQLRHPTSQFYKESTELVALWVAVYEENHGPVPDDIAHAIGGTC